jgi:dihydroorotate dehydrogenase (fumarate)
MDISTSYLGLKCSSPLVVGASPFADDAHTARQIQEAGAGAIVMRSLFEEQIYWDEVSRAEHPSAFSLSAGKAAGHFPTLSEYQLSPDQYLRQITNLKTELSIPVIASLNGCRPGGWIDYGRRFEAAGADAIELNLYHLSSRSRLSALEIENVLLETVRLLKSSVSIPIAVKLQPFYTSLAHFVHQLEQAGADGVVVFNHLYQSDFNIHEQEPVPELRLSDPSELLLRLHWLALLSPEARCSLAVTGGVQNAGDVIKALLTGADAVQLVGVVLKNGPRILATIADGLRQWMDQHGYGTIEAFRGNMNLHGPAIPADVERGDYQHLLQQWQI